MKQLMLPISLGLTTLALCLAANSRYEQNQELLVTPYRTPLLMLAVASGVGTVATLKSCFSANETEKQTPKQTPVANLNIAQNELETNNEWEQEYTEIAEYTQTKPTEIKPQKDVLSRLLDFVLKKQGSTIYNASENGAGKSTFLFKFLSELLIKTNGAAHISVIDAKGAYWPLENLPDIDGESRVIIINSASLKTLGNDIEKAVNKLAAFDLKRSERDQVRINLEREGKQANFPPMLLVIDEWISLKNYALSVDNNLAKKLLFHFNNIVIMGREVGVHIFASGQTHKANVTEINTAYRDNIALFGFSSESKAATVQAMINDRWVIPNQLDRKRVNELANKFIAKGQKFSYCSLGSHSVELVPVLSKPETQAEFSKLVSYYYENQSNNQSETEDNQSNVIPFKKPTTDENIDYWRELNG